MASFQRVTPIPTSASAQRIIVEAERLFARFGIDGVSLRQIAAEAGSANNSAVHYHFGSKDGLITAIFRHRLPQLLKERQLLESRCDPNDLRSRIEAYLLPVLTMAEAPDNNYVSFVEQLNRREKATSNICTNSGLCALAFTIHMTLLGEAGLNQLAALNHATASNLADRLAAIPGVKLLNESFFNEFTLELSKPAVGVVEALAKKRILGGVPVARLVPGKEAEKLLLVAATELTTEAEMDALVAGLKEVLA